MTTGVGQIHRPKEIQTIRGTLWGKLALGNLRKKWVQDVSIKTMFLSFMLWLNFQEFLLDCKWGNISSNIILFDCIVHHVPNNSIYDDICQC